MASRIAGPRAATSPRDGRWESCWPLLLLLRETSGVGFLGRISPKRQLDDIESMQAIRGWVRTLIHDNPEKSAIAIESGVRTERCPSRRSSDPRQASCELACPSPRI